MGQKDNPNTAKSQKYIKDWDSKFGMQFDFLRTGSASVPT